MIMIRCREASHLLSEAQDKPLNARSLWRLRLHLTMCDRCRNFSQQLKFIRQAARNAGKR
jgi:predicted anti-sigma-YlaC factor YlaD